MRLVSIIYHNYEGPKYFPTFIKKHFLNYFIVAIN